MGKTIRIVKAFDAGFNVNYKNNDGMLIRMLLDKKGLNDYNIVSYKTEKGTSEVINALLKKQYYFLHDELIDAFKERKEPFFKWMLILNKKNNFDGRIWAEINNDIQTLEHKTNLYLLGLKGLEYHHISKEILPNNTMIVNRFVNAETIWFYDKPLDDLIDDILIKLQEKGME